MTVLRTNGELAMSHPTSFAATTDRIVLTVPQREAGRVILPPGVRVEEPQRGTVVAVGPGKIDRNGARVPIDVAPGDDVIFNKFAPVGPIVIDGTEYWVIRENDLMINLGPAVAP